MACLLQTLKMALTILMYRLSSLVLLTAPPFLFLGRIMKKEGWCVGLKFHSPSSSKFQLELLHENRVSTEPHCRKIVNLTNLKGAITYTAQRLAQPLSCRTRFSCLRLK